MVRKPPPPVFQVAPGLPALGEKSTAGDLYVVVDVVLPRALDDDTRRLYEELAKVDVKG